MKLLFLFMLSAAAVAAPPRYDHVVIVMEENRTLGQIVGDTVDAPYLTSLASGGVSLRRHGVEQQSSLSVDELERVLLRSIERRARELTLEEAF